MEGGGVRNLLQSKSSLQRVFKANKTENYKNIAARNKV